LFVMLAIVAWCGVQYAWCVLTLLRARTKVEVSMIGDRRARDL